MSNDVAVFLDLDNLIIASRQVNLAFDINLILDHLKDVTQGRVVLRRAYGDWRQNQRVPEDLAAAGFELQSAVRLNKVSKNLADMQLVVDAMETLLDGHEFSTYVLLTGDRDFTPLVQTLRKRGKVVLGLGIRHTASRSLVKLCDEYIFYEDLLEAARGKSPSPLPVKKVKLPEAAEEKPAKAPAGETASPPPTVATLASRYQKTLKQRGLRLAPPKTRMIILKDMIALLHARDEILWGELVKGVYDLHRDDGEDKISKNLINAMLLAAKRAAIINVGRGKSLSTAPVQMSLEGERPFQEAVLRCDALYLKEIAASSDPFDLQEAAIALYDSTGHARYLKIVHNRYNANGAAAG